MKQTIIIILMIFSFIFGGCTYESPICPLEREVRTITGIKDISVSSSFLSTTTRCIYETDKGDTPASGNRCNLETGERIMKISKPDMSPQCSMPTFIYGYWEEYKEVPFGWKNT